MTQYLLLIILAFFLLLPANLYANEYTGNLFSSSHSSRIIDPDGISSLKQNPSRTTSGLLYQSPYQPDHEINLSKNWLLLGNMELGYLVNDGSESAAEFNDYRDWNDGALINNFNLSGWHKDSGYFFDSSAGSVGRDDQSYRLSAGQYNKFKINSFYNQTPHRFSRNAETIFTGVGSENLRLPSSLVPGKNSNEQIQQALLFSYHPILGLERKQIGVGIDLKPWSGVKLFAEFKHRKRNGSRAFGGSFFPPFYTGGNAGGMIETIEPIDYSTNEISSGFSYADNGLQVNLKYNGSFFENEKKQLSFENPFINLPNTQFFIKQGRIDLYPDNDFHQLLADLTYTLPMQGQLFSTLSWSRMHQNDSLLPPTVNSGLNFTGINLNRWNRANAVPRSTAEARIYNILMQVGSQIVPLDSLTLRAKFRFQEEDNKTDYTAFNPLTNEFGYISVDGSAGGSVFEPGTRQKPFHFRSIPFAKTTIDSTFDADYRINTKTKLGLGYQYQQIKYAYRERDKTDENRFKFYISNRSLAWANLRLSYEYADRDGDSYNYNPYNEFYTSSLAGFQPVLEQGSTPHTLADLRKFDLSSRKQNQISARANFLLGDSMDLSFSSKWDHNNYDTRYGLKKKQRLSVNLEWNYQPSTELNSYVFYSFQHQDSDISNINDTGFSTDPNAGGENFPLDNAWSQNANDNNHFIGLGLHYAYYRFDIDTHYSYNWSNNRIHLQSTSADTELTARETGFPDIRFNRHILETSLRWHVQKNLSLRFYHRFEKGKTEDWHYQNLNPLINNQLFLNASPQDYTVNIFGVFLQYRL